MPTMTHTPTHDGTIMSLWLAVSSIASVCDGAHTNDRVGFNGSDTKFGRRLADTNTEDWTDAMAAECHTMLAKYSGQLSDFGIVYEDLPVPVAVGGDGRDDARQADYARTALQSRMIDIVAREDLSTGTFHIYFKYDGSLVAMIRKVPDAKWNATNMRWEAPIQSGAYVRLFADANGFVVTDAAEAALATFEELDIDIEAEKRTLRLVDRSLVFDFDYNADTVDAVKTISGRRWDSKAKTWIVPVTSAMQALNVADVYDFDVAADVRALLGEEIEASQERGELSDATDADLVIDGLGGTLRPFQRAGVAYAINAKRTFIADEMGLGKTVQALAALLHQNAFPALVVCPASLKHNWERESRKWLPGKNVHIVDTKVGLKNADVVIINYDILTKFEDDLRTAGFMAVIFDESHYAKNPKAKRTGACKNIAKSVPVSGMVLALTGTPVLNRPVELVSQLEILDRIDEFGGSWNFRKRYCNPSHNRFGWDFTGCANTEELNTMLRQTCYVRRNKADVLKELPAKARYEVEVDLSGPAISQYRMAEADTLAYLSDNGYQSSNTAEHLSRITTLKRLAGEGKIEAACEWIDSFLDSTDRKLVVFAHHISVVDTVAEKYGNLRVAGKDSMDARQAAVDAFQNDPDARVIVLNMKAGGVGLTLTAASDVLFIEQGWTPAEHDQAEDRCHRIGQEDNVSAWYLLADGTIDDDIFALIQKKREVVDAVTDGVEGNSESVLTELVKAMIDRTK